MVYEERIYTIRPGKMAEYLRNYEELGLPIQLEVIGNLIGFFRTEVGGLNKVVHIWGYDSLDDRLVEPVELPRLVHRFNDLRERPKREIIGGTMSLSPLTAIVQVGKPDDLRRTHLHHRHRPNGRIHEELRGAR